MTGTIIEALGDPQVRAIGFWRSLVQRSESSFIAILGLAGGGAQVRITLPPGPNPVGGVAT
ncbi:MAG: hypothetical protein M3170_00810, partial [Candidatus Dormibacteraeota bacterium]|nr:hypothetical protein [Candidatus Dormibacteraeota bacterium]